MVNTYGHKMVGLKKVAGQTKGLRGYYSGEHLELFFNRNSGEVWTKYQVSIGQNSFTVYDSEEIVKIGNLARPYTMQEIADLINQNVECLKS